MNESEKLTRAHKTILIVDDSPDNLLVLEKVIQKALPDLRIMTCSDPLKAMPLLREKDVSVALLDVQMPVIDGLELCGQIKSDKATRDVTVMLITSHNSDPKLKAQGMERGADDFLMRPLDNVELVARVKVALRSHRGKAALRQKLIATQVALTTSETTLRAIFDNTRDGILMVDVATRALKIANPAMCRMMGYERDEMLALAITDLHPESEQAKVAEIVERHISGVQSLATDVVMKRRDGSLFCADIQCGPVEIGKNRYMLVTFRDITQRKNAEDALQRQASKQDKMLSNIGDVIVIFDRDGINRFKTANVQKWFGWQPDELVGKPALDNIHPDDLVSAQTFIGGLMTAPNNAGVTECRYRCKDGSYKWIEFKGVNLLHDPEIQGILGNYHDITGRKLAEEKASDAAALLRVAMDCSSAGIAIADAPSGKLRYVNDAGLGISKRTRSELVDDVDINKYVESWKILHLDGTPYKDDEVPLARAIMYGERCDRQFIIRPSDGEDRIVLASAAPVRNDKGEITAGIVVFPDITKIVNADKKRLALEAQLRQAQKLEAIGTLASGVAHEVNNPIMGIMNYAQLILDELGPEHTASEYAAEIAKETERVAKIVKNLLSFARHDKQARERAKINEIVESTLSLIRSVIKHDAITLDVNVPSGLPAIKCNVQRIQQVIMNLVTNARDALNDKYPQSDKRKKICVTSRVIEKAGRSLLRTTVEDFGSGISKEVQERMFDPFFTTKEQGKGTGLGLSISHSILVEHNGELSVESKEGKWTRMHVDLPVHASLR